MTILNLMVTGMTCGHCEKAVKQAIKDVDANATIEIKRTENLVIVDTAETTETIVAAITAEGYPASQKT
ncbi:heavy-metal-associated domain-containing protein [Betaproteobacteria bacterium LSUCC0117]|jgi:copper chaperone|nr:heavy-metal-associated domain-containing protein [Betaproteobacteria bacterium LSUCC0117]MDP4863804.1 heavy-metal-associated domain-containing protein [Burkholderiaceae bacterium]